MDKQHLRHYAPWANPPTLMPHWVARAEVALRAACWYFFINKKDLIGLSRTGPTVHARFVVAYVLYKDFGYSTPEIGHRMNRDHSSILKGIYMTERKMSKYQSDISALRHILAYMSKVPTKNPFTYNSMAEAA